MFRSIVVAIAALLAIGPTARLTCGVWCDRAATLPSADRGCHQQQTSAAPALVDADGACPAASDGVAMIGADARRILVHAHHQAPGGERQRAESRQVLGLAVLRAEPPPTERPASTPLRI